MTFYGAAVLLVVCGVLLAALDVLLLALTPWLLARLGRLEPAVRTDAIVLLRSAPVGLSLVMTALVFLPSWWSHEPQNTGETASPLLLSLALLAALPLLQGLYRATRMVVRTRDRLRSWQRRSRNRSLALSPLEVIEVRSSDLALCVGGLLRPTIYASTRVMRSLEPEELSAALAHEVSHAHTRDPLRLLWMASCPDFLGLFQQDDRWRRAFSTACEFAADAGASRGNPETALDLASALVKVARLRDFRPLSATAMAHIAVSPAFSSGVDLQARVEALTSSSCQGAPSRPALPRWKLATALIVICAAGVLASDRVYVITEEVGHFLSP